MNNGDTVPFFKMINESLLEVDLNFSLDFKPSGESDIMKKMLSDVEYVELDDIGFKTLKSLKYMKQIVWPVKKEIYEYQYEFKEWFLVEDRVKELKLVTAE